MLDIKESIQAYLPQFFRNREQDLTKLKSALDEQDFATIKRIGHSLKGVARPFGFPEMETLGLRLEESAMGHDLKLCAQNISLLEEQVSKGLTRWQN